MQYCTIDSEVLSYHKWRKTPCFYARGDCVRPAYLVGYGQRTENPLPLGMGSVKSKP